VWQTARPTGWPGLARAVRCATLARRMERIPEPELMLDPAQARAYAEADFAEPHDRFVALLRERLPRLPDAGAALDLGCGPADVTLRFARAFPGWTVDGLDGSPAMLALGRDAVAAAGLGHRVALYEAHLPNGALPRPRYDLVLSNSLLHHLADPAVLWRAIAALATGGAAGFVMDLLRPPSPKEAHALAERHVAGAPAVLRRDFLASLHAAWRDDEVRVQLAAAGLARFAVEVISDRHWIAWGAA
jgi:SAM-dependent methyltransferase